MPTAVENTPIIVNLLDNARSTGWTVDGSIAHHESCNSGFIKELIYTLEIGSTYTYSYQVINISGGYVQPFAGTVGGAQRTTPGIYTEQLISDGTVFSFFSNANCDITFFSIQMKGQALGNKARNTISYSEKINKWTSFYSLMPDLGFSLFTNVYTTKDGSLYKHQSGSLNRNNFYGTQYKSFLTIVDNILPQVPKTFLSLSLQVNQLMVTTEDGITTSLGHISELSEIDFVKDFLSDGVSSVHVYDKEGVYAAGFLRDKNVDLLQGDVLKGNYCTIELQTTENTYLKLFSVEMVSQQSHIGSR